MKTIYLVRHAKSSWNDPSLKDIDRPLRKRGVKDAGKMADFLLSERVHPDLIISSHATRALSTARIFARALHYHAGRIRIDERIYDDLEDSFGEILRQVNEKFEDLMIFGHDPSMTSLLNRLASKRYEKIPTSGVARIDFRVREWAAVTKGRGKLGYLRFPKNTGRNP